MMVSLRRNLQRIANKVMFYYKFLIVPDGASIQLIFVQHNEMLIVKVASL
jgi:hypothetical protein